MERIAFTTRVLGSQAADKLMRRLVTQTLRSRDEPITKAAMSGKLKIGDRVEVRLDGITIGFARYLATTATHWEALSDNDARLGGFNNRDELKAALIRAGFRFKPLETYQLYGTRFRWL